MAAKFAFGADLARHPRHFRGKGPELIDHGVHCLGRAQKCAFQRTSFDLCLHRLGEIAFCDRADHARHLTSWMNQIVDERVDRSNRSRPAIRNIANSRPLRDATLFAHDAADAIELPRHLLVGRDHIVECVGDLATDPGPIVGKASREIPPLKSAQRGKELLRVNTISVQARAIMFFAKQQRRRIILFHKGGAVDSRLRYPNSPTRHIGPPRPRCR